MIDMINKRVKHRKTEKLGIVTDVESVNGKRQFYVEWDEGMAAELPCYVSSVDLIEIDYRQ